MQIFQNKPKKRKEKKTKSFHMQNEARTQGASDKRANESNFV